ncbi:MAG: DUF1049 domain-containing protein [Proteobacteria bacterium]|uniref:DUF1049 domain-containing protein n=1 Tax=Candidatus Avisuccinivibrio stercorigallinarum TaxID=2840704 RepID=A0A9D9DBB6_9GAMM|nr:DUF1049 domain-containing protein [Candidatus Avisuccinivibrio stercorigallinarum]
MLKFWLYILVLLVICVLGLSIGSANEALVSFDFLIVKTEMSLAMVLVVGVVFGIIIGLYISSIFCLKVWFKARSSHAQVKKLKKQEQKLQAKLEEAQG